MGLVSPACHELVQYKPTEARSVYAMIQNNVFAVVDIQDINKYWYRVMYLYCIIHTSVCKFVIVRGISTTGMSQLHNGSQARYGPGTGFLLRAEKDIHLSVEGLRSQCIMLEKAADVSPTLSELVPF